jgi:hypothetical protein
VSYSDLPWIFRPLREFRLLLQEARLEGNELLKQSFTNTEQNLEYELLCAYALTHIHNRSIFEVTSASGSDVDRYVIITKLLYLCDNREVGEYTRDVSWHRLCKHLPEATNRRATIEMLLETGCFCVVRAQELS